MDSIDDSPLSLAVVRLADYIDRFPQSGQAGSLSVVAGCALYYSLFGSRGDIVIVAALAALNCHDTLWPLLTRYAHTVLGAALLAACAVLGLRLMGLMIPHLFSDNSVAQSADSAGSVFIPSRTTHTRFFPQKHSFAYSYLTVGVPVGLRAANVNGVFAVDAPTAARSWWTRLLTSPPYAVDATGYMARGGPGLTGLRGKLDQFLVSQAVDPRDYPHAFLVTAPKFLGYSFNPVSFWYLYSPDKVLSAMILEVNNTFDERRPYLVFRDFDEEAKRIQSQNLASSTEAPLSKISASFEKDFHVSPFNSRKGSYSVLAKDPLGPGMTAFRGLDVTINLKSSKGHPKLVARLVNQQQAIDVASMTARQKILFLCQWFWVGFVTFPRIVKEAALLFFRRRLHVWYRPEPLPASLGRHATATERRLEAIFRDYLRHRVDSAPETLRIRYISSGITPAATEDIFTSKTGLKSSSDCDVEIRVLTPIFYSRFVHYAHDLEGLFNELTESCTVTVDRPDVLPRIFLKQGAPPLRSSRVGEYAAFKLIQTLRRTPEPIRRPMTSAEVGAASSSRKPVDIRDFRISPMDAYVLEHGGDVVKREYRSAVTQLVWRAGIAYAFISALFPE